MGQDTEAVLVDITPYTFGTRAEGELYGRPYAHQFIPLIRRNSKLPATRTEVFFTLFEDQEAVEIKVFRGEDPDAAAQVGDGNRHGIELGRDRRQGFSPRSSGVVRPPPRGPATALHESLAGAFAPDVPDRLRRGRATRR